MADELFAPAEMEMDSPKLAWLKRHGIITWFDNGKRDGVEWCEPEWFAGFLVWWPELRGIDYFATETAHNGDSRIGMGETEDEALAQLMTCGHARHRGMKLWNEEQQKI